MTLQVYYGLTCSNCNLFEYRDDGFETPQGLREEARREGWAYKQVPNGAMWDFCPRCVKRGKADFPTAVRDTEGVG